MTPIQYARTQFAWSLRMDRVCRLRPRYLRALGAGWRAWRYMREA